MSSVPLEDDFDTDISHLQKLHQREYEIRSYVKTPETILIRGRVKDTKPPGVYFDDDPNPLEIHKMVIDLIIEFPDLVITDANVRMETHPHGHCPSIVDHYRELIGLSIARGFTHKVRELFGGPKGCAHTTALLQAMAPVAVQSTWTMRILSPTEQMIAPPISGDATPEEIRTRMAFNLNTCHIWSDPGPMFDAIDRGEEVAPPLWAVQRADELGQSLVSWRERMAGRSPTNPSN